MDCTRVKVKVRSRKAKGDASQTRPAKKARRSHGRDASAYLWETEAMVAPEAVRGT